MAQILVVEDENIVSLDIQKSLADMGHKISSAVSSGSECVRAVSQHCPDLVLMDIRLRGELDGIDTAMILKEKFDVPVVYLTAHADEETLQRAKTSSPLGFLLKPFKQIELRNVVEIALDRHEFEQKNRKREKWLSNLIQAVDDAVIAVDKSGEVVFMNSSAEEITGYEESQIIGKKLIDVMPLVNEQTRELVQTPVIRVLKGKKTLSLPENTLIVGKNSECHIQSSSAVTDEAGELTGAIIVFRCKKADQEKLKQQVALADRLASLGTLVSGVAHEINNPLSVIVANSAFVGDELGKIKDLKSPFYMEILDSMKDVQDAAERVRKIVLDLKFFSQPQSETSKLVNVHEVLEWAIRITANQHRHCAKLIKNFDPTPLVDGSELRLGQVFINLIINAAQSIEGNGKIKNEIKISSFRDFNGEAVIEIGDTGGGIASDNLQNIFEPFFTTKPAGIGTGLGLSISRGIIKSMGGSINVKSKVGAGSIFQVRLPSANEEKKKLSHKMNVFIPSQRKKILVVDDEPQILKLIFRTLVDEHDVLTIENSVEAFNYLKAHTDFDVVVCDLMMPSMTGMELFERVTEIYPDMEEKFVFMTGGAFTKPATEFFVKIKNRHLDKPFTPDHLKNFVNDFLQSLNKH